MELADARWFAASAGGAGGCASLRGHRGGRRGLHRRRDRRRTPGPVPHHVALPHDRPGPTGGLRRGSRAFGRAPRRNSPLVTRGLIDDGASLGASPLSQKATPSHVALHTARDTNESDDVTTPGPSARRPARLYAQAVEIQIRVGGAKRVAGSVRRIATATQFPPAGLTDAEAARRLEARGQLPRQRSSRSYASIIRANTLNIPNGILFFFGVLTIPFGSWKDALFVGILISNIA